MKVSVVMPVYNGGEARLDGALYFYNRGRPVSCRRSGGVVPFLWSRRVQDCHAGRQRPSQVPLRKMWIRY